MPVNPIYSYPILLEEIKYISNRNKASTSRENFLPRENKINGEKLSDSAKSLIITQRNGDTLSLSASALNLQQNTPASKITDFKKLFNEEKQSQSIYSNFLANTSIFPSVMEEDSLSGNIGKGFYFGGSFHSENISNPKLLKATSDSIQDNIRQVYSGKNKNFHGTLVNLLF